ncbi:unnamed protein product [Pieris macdunnoughi]|uniref:Uncharacterized protein n=1 Tax=Pieris macdunnoughi TaxID=345717 RepID=A0A821Y538_9NEOP|nr:unnamed protein product [Pieris macdunnoughi]
MYSLGDRTDPCQEPQIGECLFSPIQERDLITKARSGGLNVSLRTRLLDDSEDYCRKHTQVGARWQPVLPIASLEFKTN